jgi:hypothetical protein
MKIIGVLGYNAKSTDRGDPHVEHMENEAMDKRDVARALERSGYKAAETDIVSSKYTGRMSRAGTHHVHDITFRDPDAKGGRSQGQVYLKKGPKGWEGDF